MYHKTFPILTTALAMGVLLFIQPADFESMPGPLDYLGRDALPEDLPEIPGPPRSAERTLYDTLRGSKPLNNNRSQNPGQTQPARSAPNSRTAPAPSGKALPLLPLRSKPGQLPVKPTTDQEARQPSEQINPQRQPRVAEPVPKTPETKKSGQKKTESARTPAVEAVKPLKQPSDVVPKDSQSNRSPAASTKAKPVKTTPAGIKPGRAKTAPDRKKQTVRTKPKSRSDKSVVPGAARRAGKYDPDIKPTPRGEFRYYAPHFYRGVYLNNGVVRSKNPYPSIIVYGK